MTSRANLTCIQPEGRVSQTRGSTCTHNKMGRVSVCVRARATLEEEHLLPPKEAEPLATDSSTFCPYNV